MITRFQKILIEEQGVVLIPGSNNEPNGETLLIWGPPGVTVSVRAPGTRTRHASVNREA